MYEQYLTSIKAIIRKISMANEMPGNSQITESTNDISKSIQFFA